MSPFRLQNLVFLSWDVHHYVGLKHKYELDKGEGSDSDKETEAAFKQLRPNNKKSFLLEIKKGNSMKEKMNKSKSLSRVIPLNNPPEREAFKLTEDTR